MKTASLKWSKYIPHQPTPKQAVFLSLPHREAFYGGAARGGKSDALLMAALQYVDVPGYSAVLFRRTYQDLALSDGLIPRSYEWLAGTDAVWHEQAGRDVPPKSWRFPSGALLSFAYMDAPMDHLRYQGAAYQFIGFDELTHFSERQYLYLFSRLTRLAGVPVPLRMRAASNPGGAGHEWVKLRFVKPGAPGRPFVGAKLDDLDGIVDAEAYDANLRQLDSVTYRQLRHGDWDVKREGALFREEWFGLVETLPRGLPMVRYWDLAASEGKGDYTVGVKLARNNGTFIVADVKRAQYGPANVEHLLLRTAREDGEQVAICIEEEGGSSGKSDALTKVRLLAGYNVRTQRPTGDKGVRARPLAAQAEKGNVFLLAADWNAEFLDELTAFNPDEPDFGVSHDDQVDAASGAFAHLCLGQSSMAFAVPSYREDGQDFGKARSVMDTV